MKTIGEIHLTTGITISQGEGLHLMAGGKSCLNDKWLRGTPKGEVFSVTPLQQAQATRTFSRVAALVGAVTKYGS